MKLPFLDYGGMVKRFWLLFFLLLPACSQSLQDFLEERRDEATAKLEQIDAAHALLGPVMVEERNSEKILEDSMLDPGKLSICELMIPPFSDQKCNTWVIHQRQLKGKERYQEGVSFGPSEWLVLTQNLLNKGRFPPNSNYPNGAEAERVISIMRYAFHWLKNIEYLIVVDEDEEVLPYIPPDEQSYEPGHFKGRAYLLALGNKPQLLGRVSFRYAMEGDIKVKRKRFGIDRLALNDAFDRAVQLALTFQLETRLRQLEEAD